MFDQTGREAQELINDIKTIAVNLWCDGQDFGAIGSMQEDELTRRLTEAETQAARTEAQDRVIALAIPLIDTCAVDFTDEEQAAIDELTAAICDLAALTEAGC